MGVLKALDDNNIKIDCVAGSSAGALIGSVYCCNTKPNMMKNIALQLDRKTWLDLTVPKRGFIKGNCVEEITKLLTGGKNIEDTNKKLSIVATDIKNSKVFVFKKGPIYKAVRASISIPGIFVPVKSRDKVLVDGGVIERVPVNIVKDMGADIIIAVDVGFSTKPGRINNVFDVILQSIDVMAKQILENRIILADIVIKPNLSHIKPSRFDKVEECFEIGYNETIKNMKKIKAIIKKYKD
ncbi:MAG: patatin family protein [Firmicutes bacterium]|nr:patatin family protein [Bacillota bacterium]